MGVHVPSATARSGQTSYTSRWFPFVLLSHSLRRTVLVRPQNIIWTPGSHPTHVQTLRLFLSSWPVFSDRLRKARRHRIPRDCQKVKTWRKWFSSPTYPRVNVSHPRISSRSDLLSRPLSISCVWAERGTTSRCLRVWLSQKNGPWGLLLRRGHVCEGVWAQYVLPNYNAQPTLSTLDVRKTFGSPHWSATEWTQCKSEEVSFLLCGPKKKNPIVHHVICSTNLIFIFTRLTYLTENPGKCDDCSWPVWRRNVH